MFCSLSGELSVDFNGGGGVEVCSDGLVNCGTNFSLN